MNKQEDKLIEKYGREGAPESSGRLFRIGLQGDRRKLPPYPELRRHEEMTRWQRLKPYVYLAAMFAGIWLMMKVFYHASGNVSLSLDNPPEQLAQVMSEPDFADTFFIPESLSDLEVRER